MASAIMEALLEMAVPTSCVVLSDAVVAGALVPSPFPPPAAAFLLLFAGESEYSLVSESELSHIYCGKRLRERKSWWSLWW